MERGTVPGVKVRHVTITGVWLHRRH